MTEVPMCHKMSQGCFTKASLNIPSWPRCAAKICNISPWTENMKNTMVSIFNTCPLEGDIMCVEWGYTNLQCSICSRDETNILAYAVLSSSKKIKCASKILKSNMQTNNALEDLQNTHGEPIRVFILIYIRTKWLIAKNTTTHIVSKT